MRDIIGKVTDFFTVAKHRSNLTSERKKIKSAKMNKVMISKL